MVPKSAPGRTGPPVAFGADFGTISSVPDFYDFDEANTRLPELRETLLRLRDQRDEIVGVRNRIVELNAPALTGAPHAAPTGLSEAEVAEETQRLRMRMQGLVDQMQAAVLK